MQEAAWREMTEAECAATLAQVEGHDIPCVGDVDTAGVTVDDVLAVLTPLQNRPPPPPPPPPPATVRGAAKMPKPRREAAIRRANGAALRGLDRALRPAPAGEARNELEVHWAATLTVLALRVAAKENLADDCRFKRLYRRHPGLEEKVVALVELRRAETAALDAKIARLRATNELLRACTL